MEIIKIVCAGLLISLSGSLPLGNLNVTAMYIAAREDMRSAIQFAIGVCIIELAYLCGTFYFVDKLASYASLLFVFRIISIILPVLLAGGCILSLKNKEEKNIVLDTRLNRFWLGAGLSAINPLQVPFWAGWILYLLVQSILPARLMAYSLFAVGAGIGTFTALLLFILAGKKLSAFMQRNRYMVNIITAFVFLGIAALQAVKLFH
ncbi:MAG: LysE family transporter [Bacteroidetes bacterium]|nr:LysE family transporter [Bacteroidota bacterium]